MLQTKSKGQVWWLWISIWMIFPTGLINWSVQAQSTAKRDCSSFVGPGKILRGQKIGPERCSIVEDRSLRNAYGVAYRRINMEISGSIEGYAVKASPRIEMFTDVPEFALAQRGNSGPYLHGIGTYEAASGSGMTVFYPERSSDWNGRLFVIVHGSGSYARVGELVPRKAGRYNPGMGANSYVGLMVDKGYAVAHTRRSSGRGQGVDEQVTLDEGTVLGGKSYAYHVGLLRDFTQLASNYLREQLGRSPELTYWYGHSAGGSLATLFNFVPDANRDSDGTKLFDGFIIGDPGSGYFMPVLPEKGRDVLFTDAASMQEAAKQFIIVHQAYPGPADDITGITLANKRTMARILREKGFDPSRSRVYEVIGVSHFDRGRVREPELVEQNLDLSGILEVLIDNLDRWVSDDLYQVDTQQDEPTAAGRETFIQGVQRKAWEWSNVTFDPPPSRSDALEVGDADGDGHNENPAVALPEIDCPTGQYYVLPEGTSSTHMTGFAAYDGRQLEPLDNRGYLIDMDSNDLRNVRETITEAWRRREREGEKNGTLGPDELLTRGKYVSCVARVASELFQQHLLSENAMLDYIRQALDRKMEKR